MDRGPEDVEIIETDDSVPVETHYLQQVEQPKTFPLMLPDKALRAKHFAEQLEAFAEELEKWTPVHSCVTGAAHSMRSAIGHLLK